MRASRALGLAVIAIVGGFVGACRSEDDNANGGLALTSWVVTSIAGQPTIEGSRPTMEFAPKGAVSGTDGCNQYSGSFRTDGDSIEVSQLATTLRGCEPRLSAQAQAFGAALGGATTWSLTETGDLELHGQGDIVAVPPGVAPPPVEPPAASGSSDALAGTSWVLSDLDGTAEFEHLVLTLDFALDGSLSGFSGCNTYSGGFAVDGESIDIGPLTWTEMACQPPGSNIEAVYLPALDAVGTWTILESGQLVLSGPSTLTYDPA